MSDNIDPICLNCMYAAPFNEDHWCEIHNIPVSREFNCDYFTCIDL